MASSTSGNQRPVVISFSGIDGAGKSTQIECLRSRLEQEGLRVSILTFWDDVAVLKDLRERSTHALFGSEQGVGVPGKPVNRRDKNVRSASMTAIRFLLYFIDALALRACVARMYSANADVIIFDRYLFDEVANLNLNRRITRSYGKLLLRMVPRPDVAYFVDVDPVQARARKPEYPLEFLFQSRTSYLALSEIVGGITVVPAGAVADVQRVVAQAALQLLGDHPKPTAPGGSDLARSPGYW